MNETLNRSIWQQFGAAIDMLANAITACPDNLWEAQILENPDDQRYGQFWYIAFHSLLYVDIYINGTLDNFTVPEPFKFEGFPEHPYTKTEVQSYLEYCRSKSYTTIISMTEEKASEIPELSWIEFPYLELQIYSMRHVQEHVAQLGLILAQNNAPELNWIFIAKDD